MAIGALEHLLEELSPLIKRTLKLNKNSTCMFPFDDTVVQIEMTKDNESILLVSQLGTVSGGKYRETLFCEALKHNSTDAISSGIFAYSKQADALILYQLCPLSTSNAEMLLELLTPFCAKAKTWTEAISRGEVPIVNITTSKGGTRGLFGSIR